MNWQVNQNCLVCKQSSSTLLCNYCTDDLDLFDCERFQHNLLLWPKVKRDLAKVKFPQILALANYQWPISRLLTGLKFSAKLPNALALAALFQQHCLTGLHSPPQAILPMPLHGSRYFSRKFNQSIELAKHISKISGIPIDSRIIKRSKATQPQTNLTATQRQKNLRNAFTLDNKASMQLRQYQHVALFDDVVTTGSTMSHAYELLHKYHPDLKIDVWSICITLTS
ncbi:ComF family protein [Paraglaciecola aquimarina]|uniref:ComF family protein n=1 Tax=Paraglaciecola aquimarina TaxID=1235557 RepID=A0ABU3STA2_9ALTE|nr:ComF family protein [Paraglaciecola aquimarina]MDU0353249.1 ComF family protein [Paraglaciecola aquimarina]